SCLYLFYEKYYTLSNTLLNIFRNKEVVDFVKKEIDLLWDELSKEKSPIFFEFVKVFFRAKPTETLLILNDEIESEETVIREWSDIDTEKGKNNQHVENDIIKILGGFADMCDLLTACDLFFKYYLKRPDLFMEFYHAVNIYFGIQRDSIHNVFYTQIIFFEKIIEHSDDWKQELIVMLFLQVAKDFLKLTFSPAEEGRDNSFRVYEIPLTMSDGVETYRKLIWESLTSLSKNERYRENVRELIRSYGGRIMNKSIPVLRFDFEYIESILKSNFPPDKLTNCLLASEIVSVFSRVNISFESVFSEYFEGEKFQLYCLLQGPDYRGTRYEDSKKQKQQLIHHYASNCDLEMFKKLIDVCRDTYNLDGCSSWGISEGLCIAFDAISDRKNLYVDAIKYYLLNDTPHNLSPYHLVDTLLSLLSDADVYEIIMGEEYSQRNSWLYVYYHELPIELITEKHLKGLYEFLKDTSDRDLTSSPMRDVDFLEKYDAIDEGAFIEGCKIILTKKEYSSFIVELYFGRLFYSYHDKAREVIQKFKYNLELLEEIYCTMLLYNGNYDYDGQFLREIYLVRPSILDKYIDYLINKGSFSDYQERYSIFFELDNFLEIYKNF
ncbi:hypothetical protein, partial [Megasphaera sp. DISK 18]|uniref:hypothetical protein n=1 Tax=Megasphaera sp. DISK 18 TaxID=1776081 RepID=UPI000A5E750A